MTEERYNSEMAKIREENKDKAQRRSLREARRNWRERKPITTTKLIAAYLFIVLNAILIYACVAMWHFADLTYLGVLITDIAAQVVVYLLYIVKSTKENTSGGITFERAMWEMKNENEDDEEAVG